MKTFVQYLERYRIHALCVVVAITIFFGFQAARIGLNADFSTYLASDDPLVQEFNRVGEKFGANYIGMVILTGDDIFTPQKLEVIQRLTESYERLDGINTVTGITNAVDFRRSDLGVDVRKLGEPLPATSAEAQALKEYVISRDMYKGLLVSADGKATVILLNMDADADHLRLAGAVAERTKAITDDGDIYYGGMPFLMYSMASLIIDNLTYLVPLILLLLFVILFLAFRRLAGIFLPLIVVALSAVWIIGLMSFVGMDLDLLTGLIPIVLVGMASADAIHIMRRYFEAMETGEPQPMGTTLLELGSPVILTTVTTVIGFLSLVLSDFAIIRNFGLYTSIGIFGALVITFLTLPALMGMVKPTAAKRDSRTTPNLLADRLARMIYRRRIPILIGFAIFIVLGALGIPHIVTNVDWTLCLAKGSKAYDGDILLREKFGGSLPIQLLIDGDLNDPAVLSTMIDIERYANTLPKISGVQSISSALAQMNYVMNGVYAIPETRRELAGLWFLIEGEPLVTSLVKDARRETLIQGSVATMATAEMTTAVEGIDAYLGGLPDRYFVVDKSKLDPEQKRRWGSVLLARTVDRLALDLAWKGHTADKRRIEAYVKGFLEGQIRPDPAVVQSMLVSYLMGDMSEIPFDDEDTARTVASHTVDSYAQDPGMTVERLTDAIAPLVDESYRVDVPWLAESLGMRVAQGWTAAIITQVVNEIVANTVSGPTDEELLKRLAGSLWETTYDQVALGPADLDEINVTPEDPAVTRSVQVDVRHTGMVPVLKKMESELVPTQVKSIFMTLLVIMLILIVLFRSVLVGVVGIIPTLVTVVFNFGLLGHLGIGLDSFTAILASVSVGLGIDYAIHFISRLKLELTKSADEERALAATIRSAGMAIMANAVSVGLSFAVLMLADGQHIQRFGGLLGLALITSAILTLVVLPAVMFSFRPGIVKHRRVTAETATSNNRKA